MPLFVGPIRVDYAKVCIRTSENPPSTNFGEYGRRQPSSVGFYEMRARGRRHGDLVVTAVIGRTSAATSCARAVWSSARQYHRAGVIMVLVVSGRHRPLCRVWWPF